MTNDLNICLIGCGTHGANRLAPAIQTNDGAILVGCIDADLETARAIAGLDTPVSTDINDLRSQVEVDAAVVAVPHDQLAPVTLQCLESGLDVLVEKPMALNEAEALDLIAAAVANKRVLMPAYCLRFNDVRTRAHALLQRGVTGKTKTLAAAKGSPPLTGWLADRTRGGGQLLFLGSHLVDQLLWLHPQPVARVYATIQDRADDRSEESISGLLEFTDGVTATISLSQGAGTAYDHLEITGSEGRISSDWKSGQIGLDVENNPSYLNSVVEHVRTDLLQPMYDAEVAEFVAAIRASRQPIVTANDGLRALRVLDGLRESAVQGAPIDIRDTGPSTNVSQKNGSGQARLRVQFTYPADRIQRPIIYELAQIFDLRFDIRRADVDAGIGWIQLLLEGDRSELDAAIAWAEAQGVRASPVEGDVISG
jgi:predicted dehydrogenase